MWREKQRCGNDISNQASLCGLLLYLACLPLQVTLDVTDFIGGEVKVGVEGGRSLVVEGQTSCEEGTSSSSRNFRRVFSLPPQVDVAAVNSALSSDGVLTIVAPKKGEGKESEDSSKSYSSSYSSTSQQQYSSQNVF